MFRSFSYWPRFLVLKIIRLYQKTISFDHGLTKIFFPDGYCRFYPTCSNYTYEAIEKYGLIKGGVKGLWRIFRCNPFNQGGYDPIDHEAHNAKHVTINKNKTK